MTLSPGTRLGPYEVTAPLGAGGMGEVYRATDTNLDREVAIKVLPEAVAADADRLERFEREARILAALNHPNIAAIYGLERSADATALVLELVEGPTLAERIAAARSGLPLDEVLSIASQIGAALEAAHSHGIIHRDLKPANVKVRPDGAVKVLDFGLAKGSPPGLAERDTSQLSTMTSPMATRAGVILGTVAYMSPEQAHGQAVDKRTDVWSFGCVLYELLTGRRPFGGATATEMLAEVLKTEPDWRALPPHTPPDIRRLLERCLRKDRTRRLRDIGDARLELDERPTTPAPAAAPGPRIRERAIWGALAVAAVTFGVWQAVSTPTFPELRFDITTPPTSEGWFAMSPDGLSLAFAAPADGERHLWVRQLDASAPRRLRGTAGAMLPFWSPDGRAIAFYADGQLKRVNLADGAVSTITSPVPAPGGGTWSRDDTILFSASPGAPILRVAAAGGEPSEATRFEAAHRYHGRPAFLPDDRHFLFFMTGPPDVGGVHLGRLGDLTSHRLFAADSAAVFAPGPGHLVFVRDGKLMAQPFDPDRLEIQGDEVTIDDSVPSGTSVSASATGSLAYRSPAVDQGRRQLVWVDRKGQELDRVPYDDSMALGPALSRDGRHVAVFRRSRDGNVDLWSYDTLRRSWDRLTFHPGDDIYPLWSTDGTRMVFGSRRGSMDLFVMRLGAAPNSEQVLLSTPAPKFPTDWSSDGRFVFYSQLSPRGDSDIRALSMDGSPAQIDVVATEYNERHAQISPDGRWIAYESDRTGRFEIFVQPFPGPGRDIAVSTNGGMQARWHANGQELFYIAADDRLMAVPMRRGLTESAVQPGEPQPLFLTNVGSTAPNTNRQQYMVSPDGQSFVLNSRPEQPVAPPIKVILNWRRDE